MADDQSFDRMNRIHKTYLVNFVNLENPVTIYLSHAGA